MGFNALRALMHLARMASVLIFLLILLPFITGNNNILFYNFISFTFLMTAAVGLYRGRSIILLPSVTSFTNKRQGSTTDSIRYKLLETALFTNCKPKF